MSKKAMSAVACTYLQDVVSTGMSEANASAVPVVVLLVKPDRRTYTHYIISVWAVSNVIQRVECWGKVTVGIVGIPDTLDVMPHKWTYLAIHLLCYCWLFLSEECIISHFRSSMWMWIFSRRSCVVVLDSLLSCWSSVEDVELLVCCCSEVNWEATFVGWFSEMSLKCWNNGTKFWACVHPAWK